MVQILSLASNTAGLSLRHRDKAPRPASVDEVESMSFTPDGSDKRHVRAGAAELLGTYGAEAGSAIPLLCRALGDDSGETRRRASDALVTISQALGVVPADLRTILDNGSPTNRSQPADPSLCHQCAHEDSRRGGPSGFDALKSLEWVVDESHLMVSHSSPRSAEVRTPDHGEFDQAPIGACSRSRRVGHSSGEEYLL